MSRLRIRYTSAQTIQQVQNGWVSRTATLPGIQERCEDVNHGRNPPLGGSTDCGGPLLIMKGGNAHQVATITSGSYQGTQVYLQGAGLLIRPPILTDAQVKGEGATAISRSSPTNPVFNASTFIGEARQGGLPAISSVKTWKDSVAQFRDSNKRDPLWHRPGSSEFLNYQFGWLPFVSDMQNFVHATKTSTQIMKDLRSGSGKNTREGYHFPETKSVESGAGNRLLVRPDVVSWGSAASTWYKEAGARMWFNGTFTYYLPMGNSVGDQMDRFNAYANKLYGVRITPEVLWNLTPWTWALDWFGNTGDVLANISMLGNDSLVMKYGYMMYHNYSRTVTSCGAASNRGGASVVQLSETKKRFGASPYLLFADSGSLTARQGAIVAALGLNRL